MYKRQVYIGREHAGFVFVLGVVANVAVLVLVVVLVSAVYKDCLLYTSLQTSAFVDARTEADGALRYLTDDLYSAVIRDGAIASAEPLPL